jgi:hypothetical protein
MSDDEESLEARYDAAIEPAIEALQNFARLHQQVMAGELSINIERFFACWTAQVLSAVGLDIQRAVESLRDDDLTVHDDPLLGVNAMRGRSPDMRGRSPDQTNGEK